MSSEPTPFRDACTVQERVAIGTAGIVYRAVHEPTGRIVTFKVLSSQATHPVESARVLAQSWRLHALKEPSIAEFLDAYEDPDGFVIITGWLAGGCGGNEFPVKHRRLTKDESMLLARRLCRALLAGEAQRFPHGDIKPSNLILADRGAQGIELQVQDWGFSACREEQPPETLQFMAPERHHGHPPSVQADLFGAAATLWFLLTGEFPVTPGSSQEILAQWGTFDAAALAQKRPDLDPHFVKWLGWLLRWQPGDRPSSVEQALAVLDQVAAHAAVPSPLAAAPARQLAKFGAPRVQLPVAAPPPPPGTVAAKPPPAPPKEKAPLGQRLLAVVMFGCVIGGLIVAFVAWAENHYGHDWRDQMAAHWRGMFAKEPAPVVAAKPPAPGPSTPSSAAKTASLKPATPTLAKPAATKPTTPAAPTPPKPFAVDKLDGTGNLQGRNAGTGWKGPWNAQLVTLEKDHAVFGKALPSTATRPLGTLKNLPDDFVTLSLEVTHPGEGAAPFKIEMLSPDGKATVAPASVAFEGGKLRVFIEGAQEKLEAPAGKPFRLLVRWDWKTKKADGKRQVTISTSINPSGDPKKMSGNRFVKHTLAEHMLPTDFMLLLRSEGAAKSVTVSDLRVSRYVRDALP